jgi:hypothetical protein
MAEATSKAAGEQKTLVRGADGALYVISKDKPPIKLAEKDAEGLRQILKQAEEQLSATLKDEVPIVGSGVTLMLPEIFL